VSRAIRAWFASLSKVAKAVVAVVIAAGAVATSIGAIIALWPDPDQPPAVLGAEFSDITVDENIPLGEFTLRETELEGAAAGSGLSSHVVASTVGQRAASVTDTATVQETDTGTTGATDTTGTTGTTDTTGTTTGTTDTTGTDTTDENEGFIRPLGNEARRRLDDAVDEALKNPDVGDLELGSGCETALDEEECPVTMFFKVAKDEETSPSEDAEQLVTFFKEVKKRPLSTGEREPLGIAVNYKLTATGFRDQTIFVRWELHRRGGGELPYEWLRKQPPAGWVGEADTDSVSPNLWIPLPVTSGPFFVRLIAENENGSPLDRANSPKFQ
jgi:hypothetical protein